MSIVSQRAVCVARAEVTRLPRRPADKSPGFVLPPYFSSRALMLSDFAPKHTRSLAFYAGVYAPIFRSEKSSRIVRSRLLFRNFSPGNNSSPHVCPQNIS